MTIRWSKGAIEDRDAIFDQVIEDSAHAAIRLDKKIKLLSEQIANFPMLRKTGRFPGTRELPLPGTRYIAVYEIQDETVQILRIVHGAQAR